MTTISNLTVDSPVVPAPVLAAPPAATPAAPVPTPAAPATPGVTIIDARNATVRDDQGRLIKVKRLGAQARYRLFRALGAENVENRLMIHYATLAGSVIEIDGAPIPFPNTELQVEALIQRLDDEGLEAVMSALVAMAPEMTEGVADAAKNL